MQNFCYDEQNRLLWAGNTGTPTCTGNGTPSVSGHIGAYSSSYVYTHLGQLWQGPLPGGSTQYLYCNSQPHELTRLYATSATCSTKTGQGYASSYDGFGNVTGRTFSSTTATLSYDLLDHLTKWLVSSTNKELYVYDASGNRVLRRTTNGSGTTMIVYAFGLEEHNYGGTGAHQSDTYYYSLAGRLLGALDGNGTQFYLTDAQGSLVSAFTNAQGGASMKSNQLFGPYGNARYYACCINTAKGFLGQYNDGSGLDYFNARYYDPVVGVFLSADKVQGNLQGMNPYAYVNGNPETYSDPTGNGPTKQSDAPPSILPPPEVCASPFIVACVGYIVVVVSVWLIWFGPVPNPHPAPNTPQPQPAPTPTPPPGCCALSVAFQDTGSGTVISFQPHSSPPPTQTGSSGGGLIPPIPVSAPGASCSFTSDTRVMTEQGEKAIGKLHVGNKVLAYNPKTHKMEQEPILHVWINHDTDLVDLTLTTTTAAGHGKAATKMSETIHTNKEHPFLTKEKGFLPVGQIKLDMHVLRADGTYGVVTGWKVAPGTQVMYNLEVAQDHTFTVGDGQWVVHNDCRPDQLRDALNASGRTVQNGQNPHHIIPCALETHDLITEAQLGGFDINAEYNGRPLWDYRNKANALAAREPYHANAPSYQRLAKGLLDEESQRLVSSGTFTPGNAYDAAMYVINVLNAAIDLQGYMSLFAGAACPLPGI